MSELFNQFWGGKKNSTIYKKLKNAPKITGLLIYSDGKNRHTEAFYGTKEEFYQITKHLRERKGRIKRKTLTSVSSTEERMQFKGKTAREELAEKIWRRKN